MGQPIESSVYSFGYSANGFSYDTARWDEHRSNETCLIVETTDEDYASSCSVDFPIVLAFRGTRVELHDKKVVDATEGAEIIGNFVTVKAP